MKKRVLCVLLTLSLCLTLFPVGAMAEDFGTGVYLAKTEGGKPSGTCYGETQRVPNDGGSWGFWDVPYSSESEPGRTLYFFNAGAKDVTYEGSRGITVTPVPDQEHFWCIQLPDTVSGYLCEYFRRTNADGSGSSQFTIVFMDTVVTDGVYPESFNGFPAGTPVSLMNSGSGDGYWNIPYTSGGTEEERTFYYYRADAESFSPEAENITVTPEGISGHVWKIVLDSDYTDDGTFSFTCNDDIPVTLSFVNQAPKVYEPGFYGETQNYGPAGSLIGGTKGGDYVDIPYTSGTSSDGDRTVYYYFPDASSLRCTEGPVTVNQLAAGFWAITLWGEVSGNVRFVFGRTVGGGEERFNVVFVAREKTYNKGLYYKFLRNDALFGDYRQDPINMRPFVDHTSFALFYYDGETFNPVNGQLAPGTAIDLFYIGRFFETEHIGWYESSAFDFSTGAIEYTVPGSDPVEKYSIPVISTELPMSGFYSDVQANQETFRMYSIMSEYEEPGKYDYESVLYVHSSEAALKEIPDDGLTLTSRWKYFDEYGYESKIEDMDSQDYSCTIERVEDGDVLKITYCCKVDKKHEGCNILLNLEGRTGGIYRFGCYVNLLASSSSLYLSLDNSHFVAAQYLPAHVFKQAADLGKSVTVANRSNGITADFDSGVIKLIAGGLHKGNAAFGSESKGASPNEKVKILGDGNTEDRVETILNLSLLFGGSSLSPDELLDFNHDGKKDLGGKVTITYRCDTVDEDTKVMVYYIDEQGNKTDEFYEVTVQDGCITFSTVHFSDYAIVFQNAEQERQFSSRTERWVDEELGNVLNVSVTVPEEYREQAAEANFVVATYSGGRLTDTVLVPGAELEDGSFARTLKEGDSFAVFMTDSGFAPACKSKQKTFS